MIFSFQILSFILATLLCFRHRRERSSFLHMTARCSFDPCAGRLCVWVGRFRMRSVALCAYSAERIFLFRVCRALRSAPNAIFTGGVTPSGANAPAPPRGSLWVLPEALSLPLKAVPLRADFPRPGEDVAQRQKGECGIAAGDDGRGNHWQRCFLRKRGAAGGRARPLRHGLRRATSPKGRGKGTAGSFLIAPKTLVMNFTAWLPLWGSWRGSA